MILRKLVCLPALITLMGCCSVASADLIAVNTTVTATGQPAPSAQNVNLASPTASIVGTEMTVVFGDGTLEDFAFFQQPAIDDGTQAPTAFATAGTGDITVNTLPANTFQENDTGSNVQINDPAGNSFTANLVRGSDVSGTIDTSAYDSGTVYVVFGTFQDNAQVALSAAGGTTLVSDFLGDGSDSGEAFSTAGTPFDFSAALDSGTATGTAVAEFDFDNLSNGFANSLLTYQAINTDEDGSRARFYGIAVDGVLSVSVPVPEPSSVALLGLGLLTAACRRRRI